MAPAQIRLLVTDLDGTLIDTPGDLPRYSDLRDALRAMRRDHGTLWAVCTGRSLSSFNAVIAPLHSMGLDPDFVILKHAYIYGLTRFGYLPHFVWNLRIRHVLWVHEIRARRALLSWARLVLNLAPRARTIRRRGDRLWWSFESEESARIIADLLREKAGPYPQLRVFHYQRDVDVRTIPFTKGLAASELARHLRLGREDILAVGNGHNDTSMLDGAVAAMTGCPANSDPEVMQTVHAAGGHLADARSVAGVIEILEAYRSGRVRSDLPATWRDPSLGPSPFSARVHSHHSSHAKRRHLVFAAVVAYVVLLALASVDLVPFSRWILLPCTAIVRLTERVLSLLGA